MSSGGGSKGPSTQVVKQETIPAYLAPYMTDIAARAQGISREAYPMFPGQRLAGFTPEQEASMQEVAQMGTPGGFGEAATTMRGVGEEATKGFGAEQAARYMNPYIDLVTQRAIQRAQEQATTERANAALGMAGRGSAGGSRSAIKDALIQSKLTQTVGDITAQGLAQGFQGAQQQFERDRAARMASARGLSALGTAQQAADLQRAQAQQRSAATQQALQQQIMDQRYADFLRQRDYPKEQLDFYSRMVRGLPGDTKSSLTTYGREPSLGREMAGLGLAALAQSALPSATPINVLGGQP